MNAITPKISIERLEAGVTMVTIDAPPVNAFTQAMTTELSAMVDNLTRNPGRAIVLTGRPDGFSAGGDIRRFGEITDKAAAKAFVRQAQDLFDRVAAIPAPVIAAIHGFALGGGLELALACDVRIASPDTQFGLPEPRWGLLAGAGGTQRLARLIGSGAAKLMMFTAQPIDAVEALRIGLIDRMTSDPLSESLAIAKQIAANSPQAVRRVKNCVNTGLSLPLEEGLVFEAELWSELIPIGDHREGAAAFFARRIPKYPDVE